MSDQKKLLSGFGFLLLLYGAIREIMSAMGLIEELKQVVGPISEEGVTILLTVAGLALITPIFVRLSEKAWNAWWVPRRERRARIKKAEEVLPLLDHLTFDCLYELASSGRWRGGGNPDPLFVEAVHSLDPYSSSGKIYRIRSEVAHLVEKEAGRRDEIHLREGLSSVSAEGAINLLLLFTGTDAQAKARAVSEDLIQELEECDLLIRKPGKGKLVRVSVRDRYCAPLEQFLGQPLRRTFIDLKLS